MSPETPAAWLDEVLPRRAAERDRLLVFPSQAVADAWARVSPSRFGLGAVETDRFVGWDRFKELALSAHRSERPADKLARTLWAAGIMVRQGEKPFLGRIAGPGRPSAAFVSFFAALPPALDRASRLLARKPSVANAANGASGAGAAGVGEAGGDEVLTDLLLLRDDYALFLARHGLFEPAWEPIRAVPGEGRCSLIAPELMEDFESHEASLVALAPRIEILRLPTSSGPPPRLLKFENSYEELRWTFLEIGRLLDRGADIDDIVVTFPDLATAAPYALRAAGLAGLPASIKGGSPLSASPFGRLLREIQAVAAADFNFEAFKALLLDRFAVWKNGAAALDLVRFGVEHHSLASYSQGGRKIDVWEESFALAGGRGELRTFYGRLKRAVLAVAAAPDFAALKAAIVVFRGSLLDETGWTEAEVRLVQRAMVELDGLARAEAELGEGQSLPSPLGILLSNLEDVTYVPQGGTGGVSLFPYRVSALHPAPWHFVLGASQDGIAVSYSSLPFLREDQKEALGSRDSDASGHFALAYSRSAASPSFSFASESTRGWSVPHPFFSAPSAGEAARPPEPCPPEDYEVTRESCPMRAEAAAWRMAAPLPTALLSLQTDAWAANHAALEGPASRYNKDRATAASLSAILPRISREDGAIRLSATALKEYLSCPFAWLLARGLRLEDEAVGMGFFDARLAGDMAHAALRRLLEMMGAQGPIEPRLRPAYREAAQAAIAEILPLFAAREGPFLVPMFEAYAPLLEDRLGRLIDALVAEPGALAGELELPLSRVYPDLGVVLEGRIDRLAVLPPATAEGIATGSATGGGGEGEARAIVDYKKRRLPRKADLLSTTRGGVDEAEEDAEGEEEAIPAEAPAEAPADGPARAAPELGDWQVAAYLALCRASGRRVERFSYWSIEDAREFRVLGEGGLIAADDCEPELASLEKALDAVARGLRAGDFRPAAAGNSACLSCAWKGVCRERYATE